MQIPKKKESGHYTFDSNKLVVIGANGAGKTRFGHAITKNNPNALLISAQKSLVIPMNFSLQSMEQAEKNLFEGAVVEKARGSRTQRNQQTPIDPITDYEQLLTLLFSQEAVISKKFRKDSQIIPQEQVPESYLDSVKRIWESVITHRELDLSDLSVNVSGYSGKEMSDGERLIFYIIGQVVCAKENQIIIIDEPENHLHKSVVKKMYDQLEVLRPDCKFIYLTHDIDFAFTRISANKIWIKSYSDEIWDYEILNDNMPIPEQLYLEVLGSRKPIIFIEGDDSSIDYKLYERVYQEYLIKPLGGCEKVIQSVKAFNEQREFHNIESYGIIDRDRRTDVDVQALNSKNIWVLDVAEVENLFLIEEVVNAVALHMDKDANTVFEEVKRNIVNFFKDEIESQIIDHYKEVIKKSYRNVGNFISKNIDEAITEMEYAYSSLNKRQLYENIKVEFESVIQTNDYISTIRNFNLKNALIPNSKVCELTGIKNRDEYQSIVLTLLKRDENLCKAIRTKVKAGMPAMA